MFRRRTLAPLFLIAASLAACSTPSTQPAQPADTRESDAATIRAADTDWDKAMQARDLDKWVSFYSDDAILLGDMSPAITGRQNIRQEIQKMLGHSTGTFTFANQSMDVARSGDIAVDSGTWESTGMDKSGKLMKMKGKYMTIWKKQADGTWKAAFDMDNTDQ